MSTRAPGTRRGLNLVSGKTKNAAPTPEEFASRCCSKAARCRAVHGGMNYKPQGPRLGKATWHPPGGPPGPHPPPTCSPGQLGRDGASSPVPPGDPKIPKSTRVPQVCVPPPPHTHSQQGPVCHTVGWGHHGGGEWRVWGGVQSPKSPPFWGGVRTLGGCSAPPAKGDTGGRRSWASRG